MVVFSLTHLLLGPNELSFHAEWWVDHQDLPPLEDFLKVWDAACETEPGEGATEEEKKAHKHRWDLLEWCVESCLPKTTADLFFWSNCSPGQKGLREHPATGQQGPDGVHAGVE